MTVENAPEKSVDAVPDSHPAGGPAKGRKTRRTSYVLCLQPKSFAWRLRGAKPHPLGTLSDPLLAQACECLNQIVRLA